ncbi:MAG: hypothetical protein AAF220_04620 [Pseudomonadota bacterium]
MALLSSLITDSGATAGPSLLYLQGPTSITIDDQYFEWSPVSFANFVIDIEYSKPPLSISYSDNFGRYSERSFLKNTKHLYSKADISLCKNTNDLQTHKDLVSHLSNCIREYDISIYFINDRLTKNLDVETREIMHIISEMAIHKRIFEDQEQYNDLKIHEITFNTTGLFCLIYRTTSRIVSRYQRDAKHYKSFATCAHWQLFSGYDSAEENFQRPEIERIQNLRRSITLILAIALGNPRIAEPTRRVDGTRDQYEINPASFPDIEADVRKVIEPTE